MDYDVEGHLIANDLINTAGNLGMLVAARMAKSASDTLAEQGNEAGAEALLWFSESLFEQATK